MNADMRPCDHSTHIGTACPAPDDPRWWPVSVVLEDEGRVVTIARLDRTDPLTIAICEKLGIDLEALR